MRDTTTTGSVDLLCALDDQVHAARSTLSALLQLQRVSDTELREALALVGDIERAFGAAKAAVTHEAARRTRERSPEERFARACGHRDEVDLIASGLGVRRRSARELLQVGAATSASVGLSGAVVSAAFPQIGAALAAGALQDHERQVAERSFTHGIRADGSLVDRIVCPPEQGAIIRQVLAAHASPRTAVAFVDDTEAAEARDDRTLAQAQCDILVGILARHAEQPDAPRIGGEAPTLVVTVAADAVARAADGETGQVATIAETGPPISTTASCSAPSATTTCTRALSSWSVPALADGGCCRACAPDPASHPDLTEPARALPDATGRAGRQRVTPAGSSPPHPARRTRTMTAPMRTLDGWPTHPRPRS